MFIFLTKILNKIAILIQRGSWFLLVLVFLANGVMGQSYQIGHINATFIDSSRSNRLVPAEIYYPADVAGDNVAFASGITSKVPAISFGHGFFMTFDAYFNIRNAVVANGYIIAFPTTEGSLSPSHSEFGKDLAFVLKKVRDLGASSTSPLYNKVDSMNCVMGHSMGGGASFLAASYDASIKSMVTFAAAETSPTAIGAAASISIPALVFAGLNDCISPPTTNQQPMYNALTSACKHYIGIKGASHCQMAETNLACNFGESSCTPAPSISMATQHAIIDSYLIPWLDYTLKSSCTAGAYFETKSASDTAITVIKNCSLCGTTSAAIVSNNPLQLRLSPNPCTNKLGIEAPAFPNATIQVISMTGTIILSESISTTQHISTENLPNGIYILVLSSPGFEVLHGVFEVRR